MWIVHMSGAIAFPLEGSIKVAEAERTDLSSVIRCLTCGLICAEALTGEPQIPAFLLSFPGSLMPWRLLKGLVCWRREDTEETVILARCGLIKRGGNV